jgi:hypothetical protein
LLSSLLLFQLFFLAFFSPSISPTSHPFFPPFVSCSMSPSYFRLFVYPSMSAFIISSVILLYVLQPPGWVGSQVKRSLRTQLHAAVSRSYRRRSSVISFPIFSTGTKTALLQHKTLMRLVR